MTREAAIRQIRNLRNFLEQEYSDIGELNITAFNMAIKALEQEAIKALGDDMKICQKSITDKKVLIGFNMAVAICNKHLAESEVKNDQ